MAFVVTAGQLTAVQQSYDYQYGSPSLRSLALSPTLVMTYEELWRAQPALRAVTGFLASNIAQLPLDPYRRISPTDREKATDHPLSRLLEQPMPGWTKYRLLNTLVHDLCIFDNAYWVKMIGVNGQQYGIQPVSPRTMEPHGGSTLAPAYYRLTGSRGYADLPPDRVVHFHGYNPTDARTGVAPVETLRQILAEEHSATVYREQMWRSGARTSGWIGRPKDAPRWSKEGRDRFTEEFRALHTGDGPGVGTVPVLEDGMQFNASGVTPREAQYVESRELTREEVAIAYHVPPVMLGVTKGATFSNVTEMHKMLYQDTLAPWLSQISQEIECQLLADLDPKARIDGSVYVEFNLKGKLAGSFEEQAAALQSSVGGPWMTRDEARAMHNLPHVDGADELIVPLNVIAGGLASPNDTAPDNPSNEASNGQLPKTAAAVRAFLDRQGKAVVSRVGAGRTDPNELVDGRWDAELASDLAHLGGAAYLHAAAINAATRTALAGALQAASPVRAVADLFAQLPPEPRELTEATP